VQYEQTPVVSTTRHNDQLVGWRLTARTCRRRPAVFRLWTFHLCRWITPTMSWMRPTWR